MGDGDGSPSAARVGVIQGVTAYALWGVFPLYFAVLFKSGVSPWEVLSNRIVWSCFLLLIIVSWQQRWGQLFASLRDRRTLLLLTASTLLIATNWLVFLYAVNTQQVLQSSLGYFITPLANVLLGVTVLGERLRIGQLVSVALAVIGIIVLARTGHEFPWIALLLAISFAFYGLCRKTVAVDSLLGLTIETTLLAPLALAFLIVCQMQGTSSEVSWTIQAMMIGSGFATAAPLLLFASAARRLRFITLGFLQYIGPTLQFLVAVLWLNEPLDSDKLLSFAFIWAAVAIYSFDSLLAYRRVLTIQRSAIPVSSTARSVSGTSE